MNERETENLCAERERERERERKTKSVCAKESLPCAASPQRGVRRSREV